MKRDASVTPSFLFIMFLVVVSICPVSFGQAAESAPTPAPQVCTDPASAGTPACRKTMSTPNPALGQCTPLVRVFGKPVCAESFGPEKAPSVAEGYEAQDMALMRQHTILRNQRRLRDLVWDVAMVEKFGAGIRPSEQEIQEYRVQFTSAMDASYEADKKTVPLVRELLEKNEYSELVEKQLRNILSVAEASVKAYEQKKDSAGKLPGDFKFVTEVAERHVAEMMLKGWKYDKALREKFGGRVGYMAEGPVPLDARLAMIRYIREEGKFEAIDKDYQGLFDEEEKRLRDPGIQILPDDEEILKSYFKKPEWQFSLANSGERFETLERQLRSLPTLDQQNQAAPLPVP